MFHYACKTIDRFRTHMAAPTWPRISETRSEATKLMPATPQPVSERPDHVADEPRTPQRYRSSVRRRGVTLVEVMFAIAIVAVGLLGVLLVVPLAGSRTSRGMIADRSDRMGRNAIREFEIRSMGQSNMWTRLRPDPRGYVEYPAEPIAGNLNPPPGNPAIHSRSFCIDPLFLATHYEIAVADSTNPPAQVEFFPYYLIANDVTEMQTRMQRISLRPFPGAAPSSPSAPGIVFGMSLPRALEVFMAKDDLVFDVLPDPTAPPIQVYDYDPDETQRQFDGAYTWMATLTPMQDTLIHGGTLAQNTDQYLLSIVVFHQRDMSMTMQHDVPSISGPDNERLVNIPRVTSSAEFGFSGAGYGGGEVCMETIARMTPSDTNVIHRKEDLTLRTGDWLMLSAKVPVPSGNDIHFFRWYRVVAAEETLESPSGPFTRNVSLQGSDWDRIVLAMQQNSNIITQATLMNNVVAVYEKTVRLENSSLWTTR